MSVTVPIHLFVAVMDICEQPLIHDKPYTSLQLATKITKSVGYGIATALFYPIVLNYIILKFYMCQYAFQK